METLTFLNILTIILIFLTPLFLYSYALKKYFKTISANIDDK